MAQPPVAKDVLLDQRAPELPAPAGRIALVGVLAVVAGMALVRLIMGGPAQSFPGQVTARIVPVIADQSGTLTQWLVAEGESVRSGDAVASITISQLVEERIRLEQEIARLTLDLERTVALAELDLEWRMKDINADIFTTRLQSADLLEEKYRHEMEQVALSDLLKVNTTALWSADVSEIDSVNLRDSDKSAGRLSTVLRVEAATNAADVCGAQVEMCEEQVEALEELKEALPDRIRRSVGVEAIERQLETSQAQLDAMNSSELNPTLVSSVIGQMGTFLRQVGDPISPGDRLVEIFDDVQRYVIVDVPSSHVDQFITGGDVALTFAGNVQRKGRVIHVAPQAVTHARGQESVVRVQIEPAGVLWPSVPIDSQVMVSVP